MKAVLVTTANRGVFFGYTEDYNGETITITNARNCLYWSRDVKGFLGLASHGPTTLCRIGRKVEELQLRNITAVAAVSDEAVKAWEAAPWNS